MKFILLISFTLCLVVASVQAVVKVSPDGKTYTVDQYGKKFDKMPSQKLRKDGQKPSQKPDKVNPYKKKYLSKENRI